MQGKNQNQKPLVIWVFFGGGGGWVGVLYMNTLSLLDNSSVCFIYAHVRRYNSNNYTFKDR